MPASFGLEVTFVVVDSQVRGDRTWVQVQSFVRASGAHVGERVGEAEWLSVGSSYTVRIPLEL